MPYVNIRVAGTLSKKQKEKISKRVTKIICKETGKPPEAVLLMVDELDRENVAKSGKLLSNS
jgi:4-oxalocrotonate tautomerase